MDFGFMFKVAQAGSIFTEWAKQALADGRITINELVGLFFQLGTAFGFGEQEVISYIKSFD